MGQGFARETAQHPPLAAHENPFTGRSTKATRVHSSREGTSSLFNFATFWLGTIPYPYPVPICWDELLDWAAEATAATPILRRSLAGRSNIVCATMIDATHKNSDLNHIQRPSFLGSSFVPYILSSKTEEVDVLPSLNWLERAVFFSESVSFNFGSCHCVFLRTGVKLMSYGFTFYLKRAGLDCCRRSFWLRRYSLRYSSETE